MKVAEADSLAAMAARRAKKINTAKSGSDRASGRDFGHDYSLSDKQQKARRDAEEINRWLRALKKKQAAAQGYGDRDMFFWSTKIFDKYGQSTLRQGPKKRNLEATGLFSDQEINAMLEAMSSYDRNRKRAAERAAARNAARDAGKTGAVPGVGYVTPRREKETYVDSAGTTRHKSGAKMP